MKRRFPRREKRVELRTIFDQNGAIPENVLADDNYFEDFKLKMSEKLPNTSGIPSFRLIAYRRDSAQVCRRFCQ
jgi:hypothetical protein